MDARQTPYRGKNKTQLHFLLLAAGLNIKRAVNWANGLRPQRKRSSRLQKLSLVCFFYVHIASISYAILLYFDFNYDGKSFFSVTYLLRQQ